jgi:hypothetical protein
MELYIEKAVSKSLRPIMSHFSHRKKISQDFFAHFCYRVRQNKDFQSALIYVKSDLLSSFLLEKPIGDPVKVVVAGGSDYDVSIREYQLMRDFRGTVFYVQNLNFPESENIRLLPIGIEDLSWARNGMFWNFSPSMARREKQRQLLVGPFGLTHPDRRQLTTELSHSQGVKIVEQRMSSWRYSRLASRYQFVACPRGNGLDTHRFWETLYRGSIPVVLDSYWARTLKSYGLPLVVVSTWSDLDYLDNWDESEIEIGAHMLLNTLWWEEKLISELASTI